MTIKGGWGGAGGFKPPASRPVFVGSRPFVFFRLQNIAQCYVIFPLFSRFPPPWESRFPPPLLPSPVHPPPPFLPVSPIKSYTVLSPKSKELIVNCWAYVSLSTTYDLRSTISGGYEETRDKIWSISWRGRFHKGSYTET